jgi:hypothetical protein
MAVDDELGSRSVDGVKCRQCLKLKELRGKYSGPSLMSLLIFFQQIHENAGPRYETRGNLPDLYLDFLWV